MLRRILILLLVLSPMIVSASLIFPTSSSHHHKVCSDIETHHDQCAFVEQNCHGFSGYFLKFYYCSEIGKPLATLIMISGLLLLFGAVSTVAADFFCPNLQTISSKLELSESMVYIIRYAMNNGSGSLAIGELIGAAFFIVSVVSGCMGIIRPFRSKRITFMRDASFLTGAIMILTWIVYHQRICWYHGLMLVCYYITYVFVVVMGAYRLPGADTPALLEPKSIMMERSVTDELLSEASYLLQADGSSRRQLRLDVPNRSLHSQEHLGHIIRPISPNSPHLSRKSSLHMVSSFSRTTSTNGSISSRLYRHAMSPRVGMRTSLFGAIEFQEQISTIRRASSTQLMNQMRKRDTSDIFIKRPTQVSVPNFSARQHKTADHLLTNTTINYAPGTPEPTTDDYFTFISENQQQQIPEIRLAPDTDYPQSVKPPVDNQEPPSGLHVPPLNSKNFDFKTSVSMSLFVDDVLSALFPTLQGWSQKTLFAKLSASIAVPLVFIFTLTLPVAEDVKIDEMEVVAPQGGGTDVEEDEVVPQVVISSGVSKSYLAVPTASESMSEIIEEQGGLGWCRWLLALQAVCASTFVGCVMALNGFIPGHYIVISFIAGCGLAGLVMLSTNADEPPKWYWMLSFAGFVIALNWIFLLANQMVGLLQALGTIFNISDAIMGLTIFALGNSVGDLVANTAIAKMGFPTMAISACYAGPLLNMVLGIGISSTYQTWLTGKPFELDIAPTILISSGGLITVLLSTLVVVNINGYYITKQLGWWMIIVYCTCCVVNILLEFRVFQ
ncbi:hypothetical protein K501DRAFT_193415 [Backusella circina FSU 941]|nr:hypothetical protein K501DRAFT_193415 [Backusella circina FSU 941]